MFLPRTIVACVASRFHLTSEQRKTEEGDFRFDRARNETRAQALSSIARFYALQLDLTDFSKPPNTHTHTYTHSLRSCPLPIIPLCLSREEGMIHFFVGSHVKKPESGLFSDWIGNNTDDLRCSNWPKCRHPLVVVDFSLHFCLRNEQ